MLDLKKCPVCYGPTDSWVVADQHPTVYAPCAPCGGLRSYEYIIVEKILPTWSEAMRRRVQETLRLCPDPLPVRIDGDELQRIYDHGPESAAALYPKRKS